MLSKNHFHISTLLLLIIIIVATFVLPVMEGSNSGCGDNNGVSKIVGGCSDDDNGSDYGDDNDDNNYTILSKQYKTVVETHEAVDYNRQASYGYAYRWWNGRNPHYFDFSDWGGDCANFVSQCLIAGGLSLHKGTDGNGYGVYPDIDRPEIYSNGTIPYCDYLHQHLVNYQNVETTYITDDAPYIPSELEIGDVVIFGDKTGDKYQHAMLIVFVDIAENELGLAGHTTDRWNYSFWSAFTGGYSCATFYHILPQPAVYIHFRVQVQTLNVRVGVGKNALDTYYQDIGDIHQNEEYIAFGYEYDSEGRLWWHFWFDDRSAWTASWYTEQTFGNIPIEIDVKSYLNIREGPGTTYNIVGEAYDGMRFVATAITGTDNNWYKIYYGGSTSELYLHAGYTLTINELQPEAPTTDNTYNATASQKLVLGFLPYWQQTTSLTEINYEVLTHIAWFSAVVDSEGMVEFTYGYPPTEVINQASNYNVSLLLTATAFEPATIDSILTSYKTATAQNLLTAVENSGIFEGVIIDFEFPTKPEHFNLLVEFAYILNVTFNNADPDYFIALCLPAVDWWHTYDYYRLGIYFDALIIMGYDYYWSGSEYAGPVAPLYGGAYNVSASIETVLNVCTSPNRILLAVPYYGYDWQTVSAECQAETRADGVAVTYTKALELATTYNVNINFDSKYKVPWFSYYKAGGDGWHQVWFDNFTSLAFKYDYVLSKGLLGVCLWALGYDYGYEELWQLLASKFGSATTTTNATTNISTPEQDTEAPIVEIITPQAQSYLNSSTVVICWLGYDNIAIVNYFIRVDNSSSWLQLGLQTFYKLQNLSDGYHTVEIKAVDAVGNSGIAKISFCVDTKPPTINIIEPMESANYYYSSDIYIEWYATDNIGIQLYNLLLTYIPPDDALEETETIEVLIPASSVATTADDGCADGDSPPLTNNYTISKLQPEGNYTLKLTAIDFAGNTDRAIVNFTVERRGIVNQPPIAIIICNNLVAKINDLLIFNGSQSYDPDGDDDDAIQSYKWDFGDSTFAEGIIVTHTYTSPGRYEVKLTVYDTLGANSTATCIVNIYTPPVAVIVLETYDIEVGAMIEFDGSKSYDPDGGSIVNYSWSFGDGSPLQYGATVTHSYTQPGNYTVVLIVIDSQNYTAIASCNIQVYSTEKEAITQDIVSKPPPMMMLEELKMLLWILSGVIVGLIIIIIILTICYVKTLYTIKQK